MPMIESLFACGKDVSFVGYEVGDDRDARRYPFCVTFRGRTDHSECGLRNSECGINKIVNFTSGVERSFTRELDPETHQQVRRLFCLQGAMAHMGLGRSHCGLD